MSAFLQAFGPLAIFAGFFWLGVIYYVRFLNARAARKTFVLDFVPFTSDVAATERALPEMRKAA